MSGSFRIPGHKRGPGGVVLNIFSYAALIIMTVLFLIPFYLLVRNALSTQMDLSSLNWSIFPKDPQWHNFVDLFTSSDIPMARSLINSAIIAVATTLGTLLICSMAAYALARINHPLRNVFFYMILATLMIPTAVTFVPSFIIVSTLGWISDFRGLIIPTIFSAFAVFLFRQAFIDFPRDLEEAGRVDGLSHWGVFWRIVLPNSGSILVALAVITFIGNWNSFLWPLIVAQDQSMWTVQVTMATFLTAQTVNIPLLFAAAVVAVIPLVIIFVVLQRYLVQGVARSGLKG
jgi:multiple sugar transport system permease protein